MSQLSIAPLAITNPAAVSDAPETDAAGAADEGLDFAAVLKAQTDLPAKAVASEENLAALLSPAPPGNDQSSPVGLPEVPDLTALLPAIAAMMAAQDPSLSQVPALPVGGAAGTSPASSLPLAALATEQPMNGPARPSGNAAQQVATQPAQATPLSLAAADDPPAMPPQMKPAVPELATPVIPTDSRSALDPRIVPAPETSMVTALAEQALTPSAHAGRATEAPTAARIDTPVGGRGWDAEVGLKVVWMVNRAESRAELTLTPPQMGKVDVTLTMSGEQTNASFVAASPAAREALEQALPRLREILADAGITLGQASVNAETPRDGRERGPAEASGAARRGEAPAATPQWTRRGNGLVDTFA